MSRTIAELASTQAVFPESSVGMVHVSFGRREFVKVRSVVRCSNTIAAHRYQAQRVLFPSRDGIAEGYV